MLLEGFGGFGPRATDGLRWDQLERAIHDKAAAVCGGSVSHAGFEPQTSRQGPRRACYSHVRALPWTGAPEPDPKPDPKPNQVRLSYARNDLLTWSTSGLEANMVGRCDATTITMPWASPSLEP